MISVFIFIISAICGSCSGKECKASKVSHFDDVLTHVMVILRHMPQKCNLYILRKSMHATRA